MSSSRHGAAYEGSASLLAVTDRLLRAYLRTAYVSAGITVRVGHRAPDALPAGRAAVFVTAWNPMSRRMPEGWNRRMQLRLRHRLRRFTVADAEGSLLRWHEAMLLVTGDPRPLIRIARIFRQRAVVVVRRGQPARLVLVQPRYDPDGSKAATATMNSRWNGSRVVPSGRRG